MDNATEKQEVISGFTPEQKRELKELLASTGHIQTPANGATLSVVKEKDTSAKRTRTRRMSKIGALSFLMHTVDNGKKIRVSCLEDLEQFIVVKLDWELAKRAAKVIGTYVKAKNSLVEFKSKNQK